MKIEINEEIIKEIQKNIKGTNFKNVEDYVNFILKQIIKQEETSKGFSEDDEDKIKERLRGLGYID